MARRRGVSVITHRPVTSSNLKHERLFFCGSVSTFLQLVVASDTSSFNCCLCLTWVSTSCQAIVELKVVRSCLIANFVPTMLWIRTTFQIGDSLSALPLIVQLRSQMC